MILPTGHSQFNAAADGDPRGPPIITINELEGFGLTAADVRERCPSATEYRDLAGNACWLAQELAPLRASTRREDS
jgi:hypothetical protein